MSDPGREDEAARKARRGRNIAIALGLVAFVILVYIVTVVRMGASVIDRPL
jgi:t-SNARE complex subunit (syntaxin)